MPLIPHPHLHATREDGDRAQAAAALEALQCSQRDKDFSYESAVAHAQVVDRYVRKAEPAPGRDGPYRWVDPGGRGGATYATNFAGDQMLVASAAARALVQHARRRPDAGDMNPAHALARRAQSLAEAAQSALALAVAFAPRSLPPLVGRRAVASTALAAAGLADLAAPGEPPSSAPRARRRRPARLDALMLSTLAAARSLAAARLADPHPEPGVGAGPARQPVRGRGAYGGRGRRGRARRRRDGAVGTGAREAGRHHGRLDAGWRPPARALDAA